MEKRREELSTRIQRLKRSKEETVLTVIERGIYRLEGYEMLQVDWDDDIVLDRPIIPAVKEAMLSGELTRDSDWFREWVEKHK